MSHGQYKIDKLTREAHALVKRNGFGLTYSPVVDPSHRHPQSMYLQGTYFMSTDMTSWVLFWDFTCS
ncbi:hypothetical protein HBH56_026510 [Parastagonospora nodorum]|uniref:Uncharacterized protein n=1 Tax=Phaeosphaeria nodorum (strain SN15 / ATCC MYA-4574 / FGSC 10173) TaxID=321614 RepID=A0A7U2F9H0_PHANO|nr:hypothetical protein HBH56_026510 [Parastagonospora nodorum]QRC98960.1 hypothetical protein JI435_412860 [Parastagonospora nodorum SN15]KAH3934196.1 hypothetical protein HBH54_055530 [Parastagonospora nodorum]KAH4141788.1 hypothetical protein HBH45_061250 [Parastagonospora nodorum]KAH4161648.1 hypothetical protein HBH44_094840 [Parastagonospora nodorum]